MQVNEFTLKITNFDNQAMEEDRSGEVARMLRDIAKRIEDYGIPNQDGVRLMDSNGNPVGAVAVSSTTRLHYTSYSVEVRCFKYQNVSCSQCGDEFGPGDHGYSHCADHGLSNDAKERIKQAISNETTE